MNGTPWLLFILRLPLHPGLLYKNTYNGPHAYRWPRSECASYRVRGMCHLSWGGSYSVGDTNACSSFYGQELYLAEHARRPRVFCPSNLFDDRQTGWLCGKASLEDSSIVRKSLIKSTIFLRSFLTLIFAINCHVKRQGWLSKLCPFFDNFEIMPFLSLSFILSTFGCNYGLSSGRSIGCRFFEINQYFLSQRC